jgi:AbiV family abortive infection protein
LLNAVLFHKIPKKDFEYINLMVTLKEKKIPNDSGHQLFMGKEVEALMAALQCNDEAIRLQGIKRFLDALPDDIRREAHEKIAAKDQHRRFQKFDEELAQCVNESTPLITGDTVEESVNDLLKLLQHTYSLWDNACHMFRQGSFSVGTFLGIVCMEETAKLLVCWQQIRCGMSTNLPQNSSRPNGSSRRRREPIYSHPKKHLIAALHGVLVNTRADRRLGMGRINEFMQLAEAGALETIRQSCIYTGRNNGKFTTPLECYDQESAAFYIALAGEILLVLEADLGVPESQILKALDAFENEYIKSAKKGKT